MTSHLFDSMNSSATSAAANQANAGFWAGLISGGAQAYGGSKRTA